MNYKNGHVIILLFETNPTVGDLVCELVLEMGMNEMCSWEPCHMSGTRFVVLEGHVNNILSIKVYRICGARFVILEGHVKYVFEYGNQPHM
jgi:hypothetical protein